MIYDDDAKAIEPGPYMVHEAGSRRTDEPRTNNNRGRGVPHRFASVLLASDYSPSHPSNISHAATARGIPASVRLHLHPQVPSESHGDSQWRH